MNTKNIKSKLKYFFDKKLNETKIIFPWPSSAIRFFLKKKSLVAYRCHSPQCTWAMMFSTKDGGKSHQEW